MFYYARMMPTAPANSFVCNGVRAIPSTFTSSALTPPQKPPVTLYLYNYTADSDLFRQEAWGTEAADDEIAIVGFVSSLSGRRFHAPRPLRQWFVSELQDALATSTHDVQMTTSTPAATSI
jgi:hypothetical protein